jgi:hypothetical protein
MTDREDNRKTKTFPPGHYLVLAGVHAILVVVMIALALLKIHGGQISVFERVGVWIFSIAAAGFTASSVGLLAAALNASRRAKDGPAPAERSFAGYVVPIFCLVVAIGLLGAVVTTRLHTADREQRTAVVQGKVNDLKARIETAKSGPTTPEQRAALQAELDQVRAEVAELRR